MAEKKEQSYHAHKVVIRGTVEGYDVASLEDLKKLTDQIQSLQTEIAGLKNQLNDLQRALNATNLRQERLENFLRSFK
ncbi:MAG: hypothetical protein QXX08_08275 [Candidatus Bathyarchaeia archaeon]